MKRVEFLFDYASPWAYLANELLARKFAETEVRFRPVYVRALESFQNGFPFQAKKTQYIARDIERCVTHEGVPMQAPVEFPINGLYALRGALVAQKLGKLAVYHSGVFRAAWLERRPVSTLEHV